MDDVKREIESLKADNRRIIATLVRLEGKMDDMSERMATELATKADISRVMKSVDGLAGQLDDMRFRYAVHSDTLQQHDARLKKLEKRA